MERIWTMLTTPNEGLMGIIFNNLGIPFIFIEISVYALLFTQVLNIKYTKKQFIIYVLSLAVLSGISNSLLVRPYSVYLNMLSCIILTIIIFRCNFFKAVLAEFMPMIVNVVFETIISKIFMVLFGLSYEELYLIPLTRLCITLLIYLSIYLLYRLIKYYKINIVFIDGIRNRTKFILILNFIFAIIAIAMQFYIIGFYLDKLPVFITLMSAISLIVYFSISIFSLLKTTKLEITSQSLEEAQLYNKTLQLLHDNMRIIKHDFSNIMQSIAGYIANDDMKGLEKYYKSVNKEYDNLNNLAALDPSLINDPALYSLIASKYLLAEQENVNFNVSIKPHFDKIPVSPYILTRILGILLDNAVEAAKNSVEKEIFFEVTGPFENTKFTKYVISIKNSYSNKDVNIDRTREKGFTSKTEEKGSHGLGLWEVNKILNKSDNLNLFTNKTKELFIQDLEIFVK